MSGRKPLPTKLKMLKGTAQKCRVNPNEPKLAPALPEPPDFLGEIAREEWLRKAPVLARMDEIRELLEEQHKAFEEFKQANDDRLAAIEKKGFAPADLEEKVARINEDLTRLGKDLAEVAKKANRPGAGADGLDPMTATPRRQDNADTYRYFGDPIYQYSLRQGIDDGFLAPYRVHRIITTWEGALAVVPPECDGLVVSTEFPVFEIDTDMVLPEVLDVYFRSPEVWPQLSGTSTGTNVRRRRLKPASFLKFRLPLPSRQIQFQLREIKMRMVAMRKDAEAIITELDALLPSALDKAFKGEL